MKQIAAREAISLLKAMTRVLCVVGLLALIFTTVNVTRFAIGRDVPLPIAVLLDPMIGTALAGVLYVDSRLASWGIRPPTWSTTLRWGAGTVAALMNTWQSLWPDGRIGWPDRADPAAVLLHLTPALLLIALTETIAAYRRTITELLDPGTMTDPPGRRSPAHSDDGRSTSSTSPLSAEIDPPDPQRGEVEARPVLANTDVWSQALALDDTIRATTGKPASVWRLRTDLRIGPRRAQHLHEKLLAREPFTRSPKG
ncbi:extensin [Streptomyces sp. SL13]|uniref:Extensin n=1 Tax=Streptantibioticus silvisoli TaxID=2705255 RepID=A0AA90H9M0_9ACTN|nr:extensin [Streptantibioticus silvisoli]MDI5973720.1 extensin [Streptantibioticus silvisoli]